MAAEKQADPWDEEPFTGGFLMGLAGSMILVPLIFAAVDMPKTLLSVLILIAIVITVSLGSGFAVRAVKRSDKTHSSGTKSMSKTNQQQHPNSGRVTAVESCDFKWRRRGETFQGKYGSFTIRIEPHDFPPPRRICWRVKRGSSREENGFATDYDIAVRCALRAVNRKLSEESKLDTFLQSLSGNTSSITKNQERQLSRGPEVLRRYLGHGTQPHDKPSAIRHGPFVV